MMTRTIKRRLLRARIKLNQTIQSILNINRTRKHLVHLDPVDAVDKSVSLQEELKVLNKIAANQAKLIQHYENSLAALPARADKPMPGKRNRFRAA